MNWRSLSRNLIRHVTWIKRVILSASRAAGAAVLQFARDHPIALALGVTVIVSPVGAWVLLNVAGFTAGGVVAGSTAAGVQSVVYGGLTAGLFSTVQSIGATYTIPSALALSAAVAVPTAIALS